MSESFHQLLQGDFNHQYYEYGRQIFHGRIVTPHHKPCFPKGTQVLLVAPQRLSTIGRSHALLYYLLQRRKRLRGIFKATVWLIVQYRQTLRKLYEPGGTIVQELEENFNQLKNI